MNTRMKEAFDAVRAEDELKNHTKEFLVKKTNGYRKKRFFPHKGLTAAAACLLFVFLGWKGYLLYFTPAFVISVDVNPSIELGINRFEKVVSVETYNDDGYAVMSTMNVNFLNYRDALEHILADKSMEPYLTQDQMVAVTVSGEDENKKNEMLANVTACTKIYANVHCSSCGSQEADAAHAAGLSLGKYRAFLELQELDPEITVEDVQGLTMRQIQDMIDALSNIIQEKNSDGENGFCHGYGHGKRHHQHGGVQEG